MQHRRQGARAVLAVVAAQVQRFAHLQKHVAEPTLVLDDQGFRLVDGHVLVAGTPPADGTATREIVSAERSRDAHIATYQQSSVLM